MLPSVLIKVQFHEADMHYQFIETFCIIGMNKNFQTTRELFSEFKQ